ncbi:MAG: ABC transporter permease [Synergistaceae bacterium]|jgi:simple sugar transport system permease protein|nr:ABC transporter permease [Synergistaceae bacterium]
MTILMKFFVTESFWFTVLRCITPILFATCASLVANISGVYFLGVEGCMTVAALCGVLGSGFSGSLFLGMLCGMVSGTLYSLLQAYCVLRLRAQTIITGIALNLAAAGGSEFLLYTLTGDKNASNSLPSLVFPVVNIPLIEDIPVVGNILSGHNVLTYLSFIAAICVFIMMKHTRFGIKLRAVGEMPAAAESVGIKVDGVRYKALFISGILASFGGMYLSMGYIHRFTTGMVAGRGYISLATEAMTGGNALMGILSSFLYAFGNSISIHLQNFGFDPYLITIVPYVFIIVFYIIFSLARKLREKDGKA